ncbi:MAG: glycosyltransferase [Acetobacteraceae bacterium]|nr:glycosyltransferase [Acetobacteraceae bacterium]
MSARIAPKPDRQPPDPIPGLAVGGELSRASGLGEGARLMLRGVESLGLPSWPVDVGPPIGRTAPQVAFASSCVPPPGASLVMHANPPVLPLALLRLGAKMVRGRRVIGYWAWELPVAPREWRAGVRFVHEVWVPSSFTAAAVEPLLPGRVRVVRPPLAVTPPRPAPIGRDGFAIPAGTVVVLMIFNLASSFVRKNPLAAIAAFRAAFGDRRDRLLILKVTNADHFADDFAALRAAAADATNIRIETRLMTSNEIAALTMAADIVLSLHRSEGLGLVLGEAMLLGRPVVATGWSGNLDFMDESSAALVPGRLIVPVDPRGVLVAKGAVWADPDVGVAAQHLRRLADDPASRMALGEAGRRMAVERLGPETLLAAMQAIGAAGGAHPVGLPG